MNEAVLDFFRFCNERERMRWRRELGDRPPWTEDPVLLQWRFCNLNREHDKTTIWFRRNIRDQLSDDIRVVKATLAFRWFNRIETGKVILDELLAHPMDYEALRTKLRARRELGLPIVTSAFVVKTPNGMDKIDGILWCLERYDALCAPLEHYLSQGQPTLQETHRLLREMPYMGPFMAYEVVTDLAHTTLLCDAPDKMTWASAGPGACRGLGWIHRNDPNHPEYGYRSGPIASAFYNEKMRELLAVVPPSWEQNYGWAWDMRTVEHSLCEYDKWRRGHAGQRLKRKYP